MTMANNGRAKLTEECGELLQVLGKKDACPRTDTHWDGGPPLSTRMEEEIADVFAASALVIQTHGLDEKRILKRAEKKFTLFQQWHADPNN